MATLSCVANWPDDNQSYTASPIAFEIVIGDLTRTDWVECQISISTARNAVGSSFTSLIRYVDVSRKELQRLQKDLDAFLNGGELNAVTFVPITPSFELWLNRLSDKQYRVVIWLDMASEFDGNSDIAYQGIRYTTSAENLKAFVNGLRSEIS